MTEHYKTIETDSLKGETWDGELVKIKEAMREDKALEQCTITMWKHAKGPEFVAFCTLNAELLPGFKETITKAFDDACLTADVSQIGLASKDDKFPI